MQFTAKTVNKLLGVDESFKVPTKLMGLLQDTEEREAMFRRFLDVSTDVSFDWFHEYFQTEQAERKSKKQDFTPNTVARVLNELVGSNSHTYYEIAAGSGGIMISRWNYDRECDPVNKHDKGFLSHPIFTYDPRNYWYQVEELSDRAYPFLIFNMAIRGMNGVAIQCNSLTREAKRAYFIRNDSDNYLGFSEVIKIPRNEIFAKEFDVTWKRELRG